LDLNSKSVIVGVCRRALQPHVAACSSHSWRWQQLLLLFMQQQEPPSSSPPPPNKPSSLKGPSLMDPWRVPGLKDPWGYPAGLKGPWPQGWMGLEPFRIPSWHRGFLAFDP
jgi:hypothetical protein